MFQFLLVIVCYKVLSNCKFEVFQFVNFNLDHLNSDGTLYLNAGKVKTYRLTNNAYYISS